MCLVVLGSWPPEDKTPDTSKFVGSICYVWSETHVKWAVLFADSPEVKAWMKELDGFYIPDITPSKDGTCAGDPAAAAESAKRGWWTCGGYTRSTGMCSFFFVKTYGWSSEI